MGWRTRRSHNRWKYGKTEISIQGIVKFIVDRNHLTALGVEETLTVNEILNKQSAKI